ncbi:MAG: hypothetical protein R3C52_10965 [Hyphomonadaceae bacterium]
MMRAVSILLALAIPAALAACEENPPADAADMAQQTPAELAQTTDAPAPVPGPAQVQSTIDWDAARNARASSDVTDAAVRTMSVTGQQEAPEVPVLLPSGVVRAQNAAPPALVTTEDGYFATYKTPKFDAIVNGTKNAFTTGAEAAPDAKSQMYFSLTDGGAQISFSRFGADYLVEFECRQIDGDESCITEDEAKQFVDSLFVAQTR